MREYGKIKDAYEKGNIIAVQNAAENYARKYPNGKYINEVLYMPIQKGKNGNPAELLDAVDWYLDYKPDGIYAKECTVLSNSIWNVEIAKYEKEAEKHASQGGAAYLVEMLHYMRKNKIRTVFVVAEPTLDIKKFKDYPEDLQSYMEMTPIDGLSVPEKLVTIKDKVTMERAQNWVSNVVMALTNGFNEVFTPNFIIFRKVNNKEINVEKGVPVVKVAYTVSNTIDRYAIYLIYQRYG